MKHRSTPYNFKLEVLPISGGTLSALVRSDFHYLNVGKIFDEFIAPALYNTPLVFSRREPFTLVNVTCLHSGYSYGYLESPPKEAQPLACTWLFTFAMSNDEYTSADNIDYTSLRWINTRVWGHTASKFITIGISHTDAMHYGLKYDMLTPKVAYFMIGALSKSFVRNHKYWVDSGNPDFDYENTYKNLHPAIVHSSFYMQPLANFVTRTPYHLWVFNRHVWYSAPNLLSEKHISQSSMLYILMYIRAFDDLPDNVMDKILTLLESSLLSTLQRAEQKTAPQTLDDCLYTALIFRDDLPETNQLDWLIEKEQSVMDFGIDSVTDYRKHVKNLLIGG